MTMSISPFHTSQIDPLLPLHRLHIIIYSVFLCLLFKAHIHTLFSSPSLPAVLVFISDSILSLLWAISQAFRWRPLRRFEHPDCLTKAVGELPGLDVFVCTADPFKEPPVGVVNTVLSVMGFEYPSRKLSVYISDDGGSELSLFAFAEAARFARHWLPFCRENGVLEGSPERFFGSVCANKCPEEIKVMYRKMKDRVEMVVGRGHIEEDDLISMDKDILDTFKKWKISGFHSRDHPSVIEVLLDSRKDIDITGCPMPNLIYLSREKRRASPHHFKAGALNALLRVSNVMTKGSIVLTLDCDMVSNDPTSPCRALCYLLDDEINSNLAFVQFPQRFHNLNRHDIYGGAFTDVYIINPMGMDGLLGPNYVGSGTFFNRRALHDDDDEDDEQPPSIEKEVLERAYQVARCNFEDGSKWGSKVGFRYGSLSEDFHTGLLLHYEGWRSIFCNPERAAFLGDSPITLHDSISQVRRWAVGLLEVTFSEHCPLILSFKKVSIMGLFYIDAFWPFGSIPLLIYSFLPQIALIYRRPLLIKASDPSVLIIYAYLFVAAYAKDLMDFFRVGGTYKMWWNNQRMWMIRGVTSFPFGSLEYLLKHLGFPGLGFNVTNKVIDKEKSIRYDKCIFEFGPMSPFMITIGTIAIINLSAFVMGFIRALGGINGDMVVQLVLCGFVVVNCLPIYEGMFLRRDSGKMQVECVVICFLFVGLLCVVGRYVFAV